MTSRAAGASELPRRCGEWFLHSGIQDDSGGIARYYRADLARNNAVSTEITGYSISALCYLHQLTRDERYLAAALRAGRFLTTQSFDEKLGLFPFEWPEAKACYFFDCGIIVRGLLKLWRATGERSFLEVSKACGRAMAARFDNGRTYDPILHLPDCRPIEYGGSWSNNPGCYQLKSALAWLELYDETGEQAFLDWYQTAVARALADAPSFLPGTAERLRVMDRLHAFSYFLEALIPIGAEPECRQALEDGIARVSHYLRAIRPDFARSDVYAQLLRVRLYADRGGFVPLNAAEASEEASAIPGFQYASEDPRLDGGFTFGHRAGVEMPYANPVSTAFCLQAAAQWARRAAGEFDDSWKVLI